MDEKEETQELTPLIAEVSRQALEVKVAGWIASGYEQTSYKYRTLNRVPPGMTGLEALNEIHPDLAKRILEQAERRAADEFRRLDVREELLLTREEFKEYRRQTKRSFHEP